MIFRIAERGMASALRDSALAEVEGLDIRVPGFGSTMVTDASCAGWHRMAIAYDQAPIDP
jgi:hypothetical protein